ncbi:hypothetical protein [Dechloromonas sp. HYN0024]|uniref:PDC sensor domain-containing protein n=1 Tax=Dechloromonas sp. HYN0024 TaxID=2231055 RepID=UPI000E43A126|nr:hypothetical protein [Dechloromonas sp. HYN0024]AXS81006.1 hypothetical protein HYN24_13820 [Dechloromonas sp. HYN0024]
MTPPALTPVSPATSPLAFPRHRFGRQWLALGLGLLLLGAEIGFDQLTSRRRIENEATSRLENHSLIAAEEMERRLRSISVVLDKLRDTAPRQLTQPDGKAVITREMETLAQALEGIRTLAVFDASGTALVSNQPELPGKNFSQREYFKAFLTNPKAETLYLSEPFVTTLGAYTIIVGRMISGPQGEFAGLVTATLDSESMRTMLASIHAGPDATLSVAHGKGKILILFPEQNNVPRVSRSMSLVLFSVGTWIAPSRPA